MSGTEIMEILDLEPGPSVGEAAQHLRRLRIEEGPIPLAEARKQLVEWWNARQ